MNQETTKPSSSVDCPAVTYKVDRGAYPDSIRGSHITLTAAFTPIPSGRSQVRMSVGLDHGLCGMIPA